MDPRLAPPESTNAVVIRPSCPRHPVGVESGRVLTIVQRFSVILGALDPGRPARVTSLDEHLHKKDRERGRKWRAMPRYLIERNFGSVGEDEMQEIAARAKLTGAEQFPDIVWEHSHVCSGDGDT